MSVFDKYYINKNYHANLARDGESLIFVNGLDKSLSFSYKSMNPGAFRVLEMIFARENINEMYQSLNGAAKDQLQEIVSLLLEKGVLEKSQGIDFEDKFSRQILYFKSVVGSIEEALKCQKKIRSAKVLICGVGGVGSYIFNTLSAMGLSEIRFIDFDSVEESNVTRQILYKHDDIGRLKVDVAYEKGPLTSPNTKFVKFNKRISKLADLDEMAKGVDLIISSMDNPRPYTQFLINEFCLSVGIPFCQGGTMSDYVAIGPFVQPGKTLCHRCTWNSWHIREADEPDLVKSVRENNGTAVIDPVNMMAASFMTNMAVQYLTGMVETPIGTNKGYLLHLREPLTFEEITNNGEICPVCENVKQSNG